MEEGRRYLNFSSKITNDIKKVLRKRSSLLDANVIENLNTTLESLKQVFTKTMNIAYVAKTVYEGNKSKCTETYSRPNTNKINRYDTGNLKVNRAQNTNFTTRVKIVPAYTD